MNDLTLIIPAKYEKESLPKVLDELEKFDVKKNIVLEKSDKLTVESISDYDCKIIYQDSVGYGDALKKGIQTAETEFFCIFEFGKTKLYFLSKNLLYIPVFKVPSVASNPIAEFILHRFIVWL